MDNQNCSGCSWQIIDNDSDPKIKCMESRIYADNEIEMMDECDVNCYLPYPVEYFKTPREEVIINQDNTFKINYEDPTVIAAQSFILFHQSEGDIIENPSGVKEKFKCGNTDLTSLDLTNISDISVEYPELPEREKLEELLMKNQIITGDIKINRFLDFFINNSENYENLDYELKNLLNTNDNDEEYIRRIKNYNSIKELGENFEDLKYIERKIIKFLGTNTNDFIDIFNSVEDNFFDCNNGLSMKSMEILLSFLKANMNINLDEQTFIEEKRVLDIILKFIPNLMKKILSISETVEELKCGFISKKTLLYKEIYGQLFLNTNPLKVVLPNIGISDFFSDFNHNIYTKIILLIFIGFIISRIISLFTVNLQVKA